LIFLPSQQDNSFFTLTVIINKISNALYAHDFDQDKIYGELKPAHEEDFWVHLKNDFSHPFGRDISTAFFGKSLYLVF